MGAVFLARNKELGSKVAIKVLLPDARFSPDRLARFRREASLSAQMSHPNVVPTFECSIDGDLVYLVMPYVEGVPCDRYLEEHGPMSYDEVRKLLTQIGSALTFAHNRGIVHRDIKPANILYEEETGRWLLTDFGVAHVSSDVTTLTASGASIGTPAYMAPEQLGGAADVDGRADLYSLAAVAVEALTGRRPQPMAGVTEIGEAISATRPELPPGIGRALAAPLAVARDERPNSIEEWLASLNGKTARKKWMAAATAAAALIVAWVGWALLSGGAPVVNTAPVVAVLPFTVSGSDVGIDLDSLLPHAFTWQLQTLPGHRVLQPTFVQSPRFIRRFGRGPYDAETQFALAEALGADEVVLGTVIVTGATLDMRIQVRDVDNQELLAGAERQGPTDSLHALVSGLVLDAFARRIAIAQSGILPTLPKGTPAVAAYFEGERAHRRAAYSTAIERFEEVIQLDSSYAPAYFKRMLSTVLAAQPSKAGPAVRAALQTALRFRRDLDTVSEQILGGYETLLVHGDIQGAEDQIRRVINEHPDATDAWFLLGFARAWFGPLVEIGLGEARFAFDQALARDPSFAAAIAYRAQVAVLEEDPRTAQENFQRYLAIDSTSDWAELLRMADTLLYRKPQAPRVLRTFPSRPDRILEFLGLGAGEMSQPGGTRPFAIRAIEELANRASTPAELVTTFRMRLAVHLGAWQMNDAGRVIAEARLRGVPQSEIDRWTVLTHAVELEDARRLDGAAAAATRLAATNDEPFVSAWLGARWARRTGTDPARFDTRLSRLGSGNELGPLEQSLLDDLTALDQLAAGDTTAALITWNNATKRYSVTEVMFGLVASLWPLRLDRARVAAAVGRWDEALAVGRTFQRMAGFLDQVAWTPALSVTAQAALATGDTAPALNAFSEQRRILVLADDAGTAVRDSLAERIRQLQ